MKSRPHGFTLIEVMVALAIVAIALIAGMQASAALTRNAERQSGVLLAQVCAENELVKARLSRQMPSVGEGDDACDQAGEVFNVHIKVSPTPNPSFRRIDASVSQSGAVLLRLSTILGRY